MKYTVYQQTSEGIKITDVQNDGCTPAEGNAAKFLVEILQGNFLHIGNTVFDVRTIIGIAVKEND